MTVAWRSGTIFLGGDCGVEDGETLLRAILDHPGAEVDWSACTKVHTAVVQVLVAARIVPVGIPSAVSLGELVAPALARGNPSAH